MKHTDNEQENREDFIERLMSAGWPRWEAEQEWDEIQKDTEGGE